MGRSSSYPAEFRREAVHLVLHTGKTTAQVAKDLGISDKTLGNWVRAERAGIARAAEPGALSESEREELRRLRKEVHELRIEREILRKAAAYFAKETTR
jgi:transposase